MPDRERVPPGRVLSDVRREPWSALVTVEHGGHEVPAEYRDLFEGHEALLRSHRGWDPGALELGRALAAALDAPLLHATVTRLLVDLNRSATNPRVFSEITRTLSRDRRATLLARYHRPHRERVAGAVAETIDRGRRVLHLAVHSFTPVWHGVPRKPDLALLYDPGRESERRLAAAWIDGLQRSAPGRTLRRNDPYRGNADGLTTTLRTLHPAERYAGIEVEVNQKHVDPTGRFAAWVAPALLESLGEAVR